jgi:NAD(P)-dependent dehydrogenase (short-subunit alcohol dehydrogenase family)
MNLKGKVAMVTGAAGALGRVVAAAFEQAGAKLILVDVSEGALKTAYPAGNAELIAINLLDALAVKTGLVSVARIDILCNIAGGFRMGPAVHETSANLWKSMLDMNAGTLLNTVGAVVPKMLAQGGGKIVNVGAMGGVTGRANMGAYSASKSAVIRLTESMAAELRERNVNVNCVLPSIIDTPANRADMPGADPKKWVAPADLASVIVFLSSDAARAIHGAAIPVVGLS